MAAHVPHMVVGAPWDGESLSLSLLQWRHLTKVLRLGRGDPISYTDGLGQIGLGRLGDHAIARGEEIRQERPSDLILAVAPPASKERQRFLVEKLAELGVTKLQWLRTRHGKERVASGQKLFSWVLSAVEQSRGAWLMEIEPEPVTWEDLVEPVVVCHPGGSAPPAKVQTIAIGPEGGFSDDEIPSQFPLWDLGPSVLRVETAALVAAARQII